MSEKNYKVDKETAIEEFERFFDEMDIENDESEMGDAELEAYNYVKGIIVKAIMKGRLVINDEGEPVYTPVTVDSGPITFREPGGVNYFELDKKKAHQNTAKTIAIMASMTKQASKTFVDMRQRDFRVCTALMNCFF